MIHRYHWYLLVIIIDKIYIYALFLGYGAKFQMESIRIVDIQIFKLVIIDRIYTRPFYRQLIWHEISNMIDM